MKIKLTESQLKKIIEEELNSIILEETVQVDESFKSKLAGIGAGLAMMGGMGAAQAAPKAPAAAAAKANVGISDDVKMAAIGILQGFEDEKVDEFGIMKIQASLMGAKDFITSLQKGDSYKGPELSKEETRIRDMAVKVVKGYKEKQPDRFKQMVARGEKVKIK